ncbi:MAG: tRNA (N6-isopentenyl adenosine(37)-C2)-methylthiotransferase MiaB [Clostridiales bacterium]|jgi:tRNA-2-methylthio-N6-dimethylallyladenosine synthase|nr:tRNA (N6-isopentenyl adenosine(37)-C2)-methylthiotransferase MiaB [Clostridiales bacterium]
MNSGFFKSKDFLEFKVCKKHIENMLKINKRRFLLDGKKPFACVKTYGCQQNHNDSGKILGVLYKMGYGFCNDMCEADIIIFNTCAVRENAENKIYGNAGALKQLKKKKPGVLLGICGCMTEQKHVLEIIEKKYKHIDFVFGTNLIHNLPEIIERSLKSRTFKVYKSSEIIENIPQKRSSFPVASVMIVQGCDNFCTYCIVPYVRGREISREPGAIIFEIKELAKNGYKEIILLGQNVNSYGKNLGTKITFSELLENICKIDGIERIRFISPHPKDVSDELIKVISDNGKICKQLHLPVQAGSNEILKRMNRKYTKEQYLSLVLKIREKIPNIAITTDVIVGFPGETNEDFDHTLDVIQKVRFDMIFSFLYSKRRGTPAFDMVDFLTSQEKQKNFNKLIEIQNKISRQKNDAFLGKIVEVLVEGTSKSNMAMMFGRTDGGKIVNFGGGKELIGKILNIKVIETKTWYLIGKVC